MTDDFVIFDRVQMKKPHACGQNAWRIVRTGADIKIKCETCGRVVMMSRADFIKRGKKLLPPIKAE